MHIPDSLNLEMNDMINVSVTLFMDKVLQPAPYDKPGTLNELPDTCAAACACACAWPNADFGDGIISPNSSSFSAHIQMSQRQFCCEFWRTPVLPRKYADLGNVM